MLSFAARVRAGEGWEDERGGGRSERPEIVVTISLCFPQEN